MELSGALSNSPAPKRRLLWMQSKVGSPILMAESRCCRDRRRRRIIDVDSCYHLIIASGLKSSVVTYFFLMREYVTSNYRRHVSKKIEARLHDPASKLFLAASNPIFVFVLCDNPSWLSMSARTISCNLFLTILPETVHVHYATLGRASFRRRHRHTPPRR